MRLSSNDQSHRIEVVAANTQRPIRLRVSGVMLVMSSMEAVALSNDLIDAVEQLQKPPGW